MPIDWANNHDAVRGDAHGINLRHPLVHLAERVVRIAGARPMTEQLRGGDTGMQG